MLSKFITSRGNKPVLIRVVMLSVTLVLLILMREDCVQGTSAAFETLAPHEDVDVEFITAPPRY